MEKSISGILLGRMGVSAFYRWLGVFLIRLYLRTDVNAVHFSVIWIYFLRKRFSTSKKGSIKALNC